MKKILSLLAFVVIVVSAYFFYQQMQVVSVSDIAYVSTPATFKTPEGKSFTIQYDESSEYARLVFEEEHYDLVRAVSGSGARYTNADGSVDFWEHQGEATIKIGTETFVAKWEVESVENSNLPNRYDNKDIGYSINYPNDWTVDTSYEYNQLGPEEPVIPGIKFHIPEAMATGTNLSSFDTGVSVEVMPGMPTCTAYPFLIQPESVVATTSNGVEYSLGTMVGAGVGNLYEEFVYALSDTDPCIAVRYYIHSTQIANYEPGTKVEYDREGLFKLFDEIRNSLVVR